MLTDQQAKKMMQLREDLCSALTQGKGGKAEDLDWGFKPLVFQLKNSYTGIVHINAMEFMNKVVYVWLPFREELNWEMPSPRGPVEMNWSLVMQRCNEIYAQINRH